MKCPVCYTTDIHELVTVCPVCRADLTAFAAVESAEEDFVELARERAGLEGQVSQLRKDHKEEVKELNNRINKMWLILLLLPLLHLMCYKNSKAEEVQSIPEIHNSATKN